jgi:hypothetical protein
VKGGRGVEGSEGEGEGVEGFGRGKVKGFQATVTERKLVLAAITRRLPDI